MNPQHLSDEAVAACADGVLSGHARDRAARHLAECDECAQAVRVQREAAWALRAAPAPALPTGLLDRLRTVPQTTPLRLLPTAIGPDGNTVLPNVAPMAAFVPATSQRGGSWTKPMAITAAAMALAGAVAAGSVARSSGTAQPGVGHTARSGTASVAPGHAQPVGVFRHSGR